MDRFIEFAGQLVGDYGTKQVAAAGGFGVVGAYLFGGWPLLLQVLLIMAVADFVTGIMAAGTEGKLRSSRGLVGIARKVFIFVIISIAHQVDTVLGDQHMLWDATIFFYMANELLSIIENGGRIGVPIPGVIKQAVEVLKGKVSGTLVDGIFLDGSSSSQLRYGSVSLQGDGRTVYSIISV